MRKLNSKGFTIIELLVVIVIIGILVALALPQLFAAQERGRDTERKNDLKNIKTQLETYFNDEGAYPTGVTNAAGLVAFDSGVLNLTADDTSGPKDSEVYGYTSDGETYTLSATLENENDSAATGASGLYEVESVNQGTPAPATP